jgi:uncharacterized oxidoreductase
MLMKITGNTILITGGGSGIGRGLAEAFHALGNRVVIAGRRRDVLAAVAEANPGMAWMELDITDKDGIVAFADRVLAAHPSLNVLINNSGIMRVEKVIAGGLEDAEAVVATNLLGPIRLTAALLPAISKQPYSAVMNVSSGLGFVPLAFVPTYCATKAALHSYTESLRYQLRETATEVLELIPPYVQTHLLHGAEDPRAMPLADFIAEVMEILKSDSQVREICVENAKRLRLAAASGHYAAAFNGLNQAMGDGD